MDSKKLGDDAKKIGNGTKSVDSSLQSFIDDEAVDDGAEDMDFDDSDITSSVSNSTRSLPEAFKRTELVIDHNTMLMKKQNHSTHSGSSSLAVTTFNTETTMSSSLGENVMVSSHAMISSMSYEELSNTVSETLQMLKKLSMSVEYENMVMAETEQQVTLLKLLISFLNYNVTQIPTSPSEILSFSKLVMIRLESYLNRLEEMYNQKIISVEQKIRLLPLINEVKTRSLVILRGIACLAVGITSVDICEFEKQSGEYPYLLGMKISPFFGIPSAVPVSGKPDHRGIIHSYVRDKILSDGYRIRDNNVCQETITTDKNRTRFWKPIMTIKEYVWNSFNRLAQKDIYDHYVKIGDSGMEAVVKMITNKVDDIPRVNPLGNYRSFRNGIYKLDDKSVFYLYSDPMCPNDICTECYIDQVFDPVWMQFESPLMIPTPYFDAFLKTQNICTGTAYISNDGKVLKDKANKEVSMRNVYISFLYMMGRLLRPIFHLNSMDNKIYSDNLQKVLIIVGKPGSGKSTIINLIRAMFHSSNVSTIASNADKSFGLENFRNDQVKLGVCYELAKNFNIPTSVMKSMVAGEKVLLNGKNISILDTDWNVPLVLLGNDNEIPTDWGRDGTNDGMVRRMALFQFKNKPKSTDLMLHTRLEKELPAIMCKINRIYLEYSSMHHESLGIKLFEHPYFTDSIKRFMSQSNPMESFFSTENDQIVFTDSSASFTSMTDLWNFFLYYSEHTLKMTRQSMKYLKKQDFTDFINVLDAESRVQLVGPVSTIHLVTRKGRMDNMVCGIKIDSPSFNEEFALQGSIEISSLLDEKRREAVSAIVDLSEEIIVEDEFITNKRKRMREESFAEYNYSSDSESGYDYDSD